MPNFAVFVTLVSTTSKLISVLGLLGDSSAAIVLTTVAFGSEVSVSATLASGAFRASAALAPDTLAALGASSTAILTEI